MKTVALHMMGGFGNQLFQYAFARGYCERHGYRLETDPWVGQKIFDGIEDPPISRQWPRLEEKDIDFGAGDISFNSYFQNQKCADYYSKSKAQDWFQIQEKWVNVLRLPRWHIMGHYRNGDYKGAGYPVVSQDAIYKAMSHHVPKLDGIRYVSCDFPEENSDLPQDISFLQDFYTMACAVHLFRANSSFSWWASTIGNADTYSPRIDNLIGGQEHDNVTFEKGNHCRLAHIDFISDIYLKP